MPIRSMTGFAQVRGEIQRPDGASGAPSAGSAPSNGRLAFALSLKSVNHRFLDLHFRLPSGTDSLEMQLRRLLKEKMGRGHVEISLAAEPDLNSVLRIPGALDSANDSADGEIEAAVMAKVGEALDRLNQMREEEGRGIARELRERMVHLTEAGKSVQQHRRAVLQNYSERLQSRLQELLGTTVDKERVLQEAALLVDRSDIQEEIVRLENHVQHFLGLLEQGGEIGKKLDFLLQEMNREANTLLSKT